MDTEVENCETHEVGVDRKKTIGRDENVTIKRHSNVDVGVNATHKTGEKHIINVGESQSVLTMDKEGNVLLEAATSIKLKVNDNYILISPAAIEIQVTEGSILAQSEDEALFKGTNFTSLGGGTDAELKANDTVSITGVNITDIKGALIKVNS
jgi:type VI secretion system secreted protein VgrG